MPTIQDLFKDLAQKAGVNTNDPDFMQFISASALREIEVPDSFTQSLHSGLMTKEAAINNPDVYRNLDIKAKGKYFGIIDNQVNGLLHSFGEFLNDDQKDKIKTEVDTPKKLRLLEEYLVASFGEKAKTDNTGKKTTEELRKIEEQYNNKIKEINSQWENKWNQKENEIKQDKINSFLTNKIIGFNIIDNLPGGKDYLANATISELAKNYHLELSDSGLELRSKEDPTKEIYVNNNKLTIDSVLTEKLAPYVKKSDTKQPNQTTQTNSNGSHNFGQNKPMTLQEINAVKIKQQADQEIAKFKQAS